ERVLVEALGARHVVGGHDFRFGCDLKGDFELLARVGERHGFGVTQVPPYSVDGERVSSSRIREMLASGDLAGAARSLGRPYRMTGKVVHGGKLGRTLGFPTDRKEHTSELQSRENLVC